MSAVFILRREIHCTNKKHKYNTAPTHAHTYVVDDVLEEYGHARVLQVLEVAGVVDQLRHFVQAELYGANAS